MNQDRVDTGRSRQLAVFLSFIVPGLGQVYNGELIKGTSFFVILQAYSLSVIDLRVVTRQTSASRPSLQLWPPWP